MYLRSACLKSTFLVLACVHAVATDVTQVAVQRLSLHVALTSAASLRLTAATDVVFWIASRLEWLPSVAARSLAATLAARKLLPADANQLAEAITLLPRTRRTLLSHRLLRKPLPTLFLQHQLLIPLLSVA